MSSGGGSTGKKLILGILALIAAIFVATLIFHLENKAIKSITEDISNSAIGQPPVNR